MHIYNSCEKDTVSVQCRRRTIYIIVSVVGSMIDTNSNIYCLDVPISLLCDEYKKSQGVFYLLVCQRGRICWLVGVHIMNILQLFHYCSLVPVAKNTNTLLHAEILYHHNSHDVIFYILFLHTRWCLCILCKVHVDQSLLCLVSISYIASL